MSTSKVPFNVILTSEQHEKLKALATALDLPRAAVLRTSLTALYAHVIIKTPTCANGHGCFVPNMHARPTTPQPGPGPTQ